MENSKLKIKIGEHEFESDGPPETVQAQFAAFREMVQDSPRTTPTPAPATTTQMPNGETPVENDVPDIGHIMTNKGRIVSLTARAGSTNEEILLVLLGQKRFRENDSVSGAEITGGLRQTGGANGRIDYRLNKMTEAGDVITIGTNRARRYRLTNQGIAKAQGIATKVIATVA